MSKIPCKDCITFAMCRIHAYSGHAYTNFMKYIEPKCSIIRDYALPQWDTPAFNYSSRNIDRIMYFLKYNKEYDGPL